jgi:hypothetical protein
VPPDSRFRIPGRDLGREEPGDCRAELVLATRLKSLGQTNG